MPVAGGAHRGGPPAWPAPPPEPNEGPPWRRPSRGAEGMEKPAPVNITLKAVKKPNTAAVKQQPTETTSSVPAETARRRPQSTKQQSVCAKEPPPPQPEQTSKTSNSEPRMRPQVSANKQPQENGIVAPAPPPPPPPPAPPMAPPPPPMLPDRQPLPPSTLMKLDQIRKVPKQRPDWGAALKEIENKDKRSMRHVVTDDRSKPILTSGLAKTGANFCYESEKPKPNSVHNLLLNQIQKGVNLKRVQCNDRSKPALKGLRKLRRQITVEEQLQRAQSIEEGSCTPPIPTEAEVIDDDDIDKLRDDLQSTKQMLEQEIKAKQKAERDRLGLQLRVGDLEEEVSQMRLQLQQMKDREERQAVHQEVPQNLSDPSSLWESKFKESNQQLSVTTAKMEDAEQRAAMLQRKVDKLLAERGMSIATNEVNNIVQVPTPEVVEKKPEVENVVTNADVTPQQSIELHEDSTETETETESSEDEDSDNEEAIAEKARKKEARERQLLSNKLRTVREKQAVARKERCGLKETIRTMKKEVSHTQKKYHDLEKELQRMASVAKMADAGDDADSESSSSSEEESSSSSEEEIERVANVPESMEQQIKRLDSALSAKRKGNFMLKAQAEKMKAQLLQEKDRYKGLEEELNTVLSELN